MRVPDQIKKCVAFLGYKQFGEDGETFEYQFEGSALLLADEKAKSTCIITARHIIDGLVKHGVEEIWLRLNNKSGTFQWLPTKKSDWKSPKDKSLDIAILFGFLKEADHFFLDREWALTPEKAQELSVGVGDEIFIAGLFSYYAGKPRNVPIVRVGNLAAYPEEKIRVKKFGEMDAYLIEARSIGALSGSPVFYNAYGSHKGVFRPSVPYIFSPLQNDQSFYWIGIIHGHYPQKSKDISEALEIIKEATEHGCWTKENVADSSLATALQLTAESIEDINTGIAIVVPVAKVLESFDELRKERIA